MAHQQYQCCFCGEMISDRTPDPCSLALTAGFTQAPDRQVNQGFFCHMECFKKRLHPTTPFYAEDILDDE
jgi:hypothetical protein